MKIKYKTSKHFLWLTYTSKIEIKGETVTFVFNSGVESLSFKSIHSIMFYGTVIDLSQQFLEKCALNKIPITIHRRNMPKAVWITPSFQVDNKDLITKQISFRENKIKQRYIARLLIKAKLKSSAWLIKESKRVKFNKNLTVSQIRSIEAIWARRYWDEYFEKLGKAHWTRRGENPIAKILDAVSKYISSILLRWILYHNLSPYHGYMHVQTDYPALVYDLFDPYRGYFDQAVFNSLEYLIRHEVPEQKWLPIVVNDLKTFLTSSVYTDATRQIVTVSELMHGVVLALRAYLIGDAERFIVPIIGKPNGGRPMKTGYRLYGKQAGRTDFWEQAKETVKATQSMVT